MASIIEAKGICYSYPQSERQVLDNCYLEISAGEIVSILGPNGAGKSTMLNCLCDLLTPQQGTVSLNGTNIRTMDRRSVAKVIGYVQQNQKSAFSHTVFDYVLMGRAATVGLFKKPNDADRRRVSEVLEQMNIQYLKDAAITEISGGERQQAAIARAVVQNPQVIFFDEPTSHLDYGNQINTLRLIGTLQKQGFAVVMTTHNPDHCMMLGGKVAILNKNGHLEVGDISVLTEERLKDVYNTELRLSYVESVDRVACIPRGL